MKIDTYHPQLRHDNRTEQNSYWNITLYTSKNKQRKQESIENWVEKYITLSPTQTGFNKN